MLWSAAGMSAILIGALKGAEHEAPLGGHSDLEDSEGNP
jgi:hypothetical protein